jgi:formate dehydrogenase subunit delta
MRESTERLVSMVNDIANYFHSEPDRSAGIDGIAGHIRRFWEPRMRQKIIAHLHENDGEGLSDLGRAAIDKLAVAAAAGN